MMEVANPLGVVGVVSGDSQRGRRAGPCDWKKLTICRALRFTLLRHPQITAFNFPNAVFGWNFSLSCVTGNATVWKPAPTTPLTAIATTKIVQSVLEANKLDAGLAALVCGGGETGEALVNDKRVDLLSFTGSEARGREVGMKVAGRFGQSLLELGGNNVGPVIALGRRALRLPMCRSFP